MTYEPDDDLNGKTNYELDSDPALKPTGELAHDSNPAIPLSAYAPPGDIPSDPHLKSTAVDRRDNIAQPTIVHHKPIVDPNITLEADAVEVDMAGSHCPFCDAPRRSMDNFCYNCGNLLKVLAFDECRHCQATLVPSANFCHNCGRRIETSPQLTLRIAETDISYVLRGEQDSYSIGRTVPEQHNFVDIDLGPLGQRKISRQHARIFLKDNQWLVEDLNSKGGTRIFNQVLQPRTPVVLQDGMVVYFADVKFKVELAN